MYMFDCIVPDYQFLSHKFSMLFAISSRTKIIISSIVEYTIFCHASACAAVANVIVDIHFYVHSS